jgi:hypothetical protein
MPAAKTTRLRALELAVASFDESECPHGVAFRAQIYFEWLEGRLEFVQEKTDAPDGDSNVVPMKPKGNLQ